MRHKFLGSTRGGGNNVVVDFRKPVYANNGSNIKPDKLYFTESNVSDTLTTGPIGYYVKPIIIPGIMSNSTKYLFTPILESVEALKQINYYVYSKTRNEYVYSTDKDPINFIKICDLYPALCSSGREPELYQIPESHLKFIYYNEEPTGGRKRRNNRTTKKRKSKRNKNKKRYTRSKL